MSKKTALVKKLNEARDQDVLACQKEINQVLEKYGCGLKIMACVEWPNSPKIKTPIENILNVPVEVGVVSNA